MNLYHFKLTKRQLDAIPDAERNLLVLVGHVANELSVLTKLFHFCSTHEAPTEVEAEARNAQAMTLGRLLTGKLYECWNLLQSAFFATQVSRKYEPTFDQASKEALDSLKRYFGRKNIIADVRNRHAFHYAPDQIAAGYAKLADNDSLNVYMSETNANTLYAFSDIIAGRALVEDIDPNDHARAFDTLIKETSKVVGWFNQVIAACMLFAIENYLGGDLRALGAVNIEITGAKDWKGITIPYFVEIADTEVT